MDQQAGKSKEFAVKMITDQHGNKVFSPDWTDFELAVHAIAMRLLPMIEQKEFDSIYGIPRGGLVLAVKLSHLLGLPLMLSTSDITPKTLLVDEIVDSAHTLKEYRQRYPRNFFVSWYVKESKLKPDYYVSKAPKDVWIRFSWEL